jgi:hypothetical protein
MISKEEAIEKKRTSKEMFWFNVKRHMSCLENQFVVDAIHMNLI